MWLPSNKLFLSDLKLTDTWAVYTCVVLLTGITFVCDVSIRKCYMVLPGLKLTFAVWLYLLLWMRKLTNAIVVYTFVLSCGCMYNTCQSRLVLMRLLTNKLFLPGLKLTDTWVVYTCVVLLTGITFVCDVYIRKCYMGIRGLNHVWCIHS